MALIRTVYSSDLYHMACKMGRGDCYGYNGWEAIGNYLEEVSEDTGEDIEIDIIAICCEYCFTGSADEFYDEYEKMNISEDEWDEQAEDEKLEAVQKYLQENAGRLVICESGLIIWAD